MPGLGTVLVGDDPGSHAYVARQAPRLRRGRHRLASGATCRRPPPRRRSRRSSTSSTPTRRCTGYIVQLPLPEGLDASRVLERMDPAKDADGLHPVNLGRLVLHEPGAAAVHAARHRRSCSAATACRSSGAEVVRRRPRHHRRPPARPAADPPRPRTPPSPCATPAPRTWPRTPARADIVVAAAGVPGLITADMVQARARPCSTSASPGPTARLVGDVAPDVSEVAGWLAPIPGGVGPMTRAMLLTNVVEAAEKHGRSAGLRTPGGSRSPRLRRSPAGAPGCSAARCGGTHRGGPDEPQRR